MPKRRAQLPLVGAAALVSIVACGGVDVPEEGIPELFALAEADPALEESAFDGCLRIRHVWKAEVRVVHRTAGQPVSSRLDMLVDSARTPFASFWDGYMSSGFRRWARRELDLVNDPRARVPLEVDVPALILDATERVSQQTGRRACAEWYLVYGPGWTDLGVLSGGKMLIDYFGLSRDESAAQIERALPHEIAHIIHGDRVGDAEAETLLSAVLSEGFASYFAYRYWGGQFSPAEALGYSEAEWQWAVAHEEEIWARAREQLASRDDDLSRDYRSRSKRIHPGGPSAIGYFIGFQISEAYVDRHGEEAYFDIFDLPVRQVLEMSGYGAL